MLNLKTVILLVLAIGLLTGALWYGNQYRLERQQAAALEAIGGNQDAASLGNLFLGDPNAPVTLIEYSSHFCGHCVAFHKDTLPLLMDIYVKTGKVKIYPRLLSPVELSEAVLCAQEQNEFSKYNDYLFEHADELKAVDDLKNIARELSLNSDQFNVCLDDKKYEGDAIKWFDQATADGVEGTPTFFINGEKLVGNQPYAVFEQAIEKALGNR